MQETAVVPHHDIADPPAMCVNELSLCGVREQLAQQPGAFPGRQADDVRCVVAEIERLSAALRMGAHQRMVGAGRLGIEGGAEGNAQSGDLLFGCVRQVA